MKSTRRKLTFPISDTISGPGTYEGEVIMAELKENDGEIPAVDTQDSIDEFGNGTAKDIASSTKLPKP